MLDHRTECLSLAKAFPPGEVMIMAEIFQSEGTRNEIGRGVCRGLAAEWIKCHLFSATEVSEFRKQAASRVFDRFIMVHKASQYFSQQVEELSARDGKAMREALKFLKRYREGTLPSRTPEEIRENQKRCQQSMKIIEEFDRAMMEALRRKINSLSGFLSHGQLLELVDGSTDMNLDSFGADPSHYFVTCGYYYMSFKPPKTEERHVIAFYIGPNGCGMVDANTCEFQFRKRSVLCEFFFSYWLMFYRNEYAGGTCTFYFFPGHSQVLDNLE